MPANRNRTNLTIEPKSGLGSPGELDSEAAARSDVFVVEAGGGHLDRVEAVAAVDEEVAAHPLAELLVVEGEELGPVRDQDGGVSLVGGLVGVDGRGLRGHFFLLLSHHRLSFIARGLRLIPGAPR